MILSDKIQFNTTNLPRICTCMHISQGLDIPEQMTESAMILKFHISISLYTAVQNDHE